MIFGYHKQEKCLVLWHHISSKLGLVVKWGKPSFVAYYYVWCMIVTNSYTLFLGWNFQNFQNVLYEDFSIEINRISHMKITATNDSEIKHIANKAFQS